MRHTIFYRVSDCLNAAGTKTSVCMRAERLQELLPFAYGDKTVVNRTIRAASRDVALVSNLTADGSALAALSWSQAVVVRAAAKLRGSYEPAKAAVLAAERQAAEALAAENNSAWTQVA
jgi:hypothetical protein